jgi:hypothetical protein
MEQTSTFALMTPDGALSFHQGIPGKMWAQTDPHYGDTEGFTVEHPDHGSGRAGLRAYVGAVSSIQTEKYAPNPIASQAVMILAAQAGGRLGVALDGNVTVCGYAPQGNGDVDVAGLTEEQRARIAEVHALVVSQ